MKRAMLLLAAALTLTATGCAGNRCSCGGNGCGPGQLRPRGFALHRDHGGMLGHRGGPGAADEGMPGPGSAAIGYPYYTVRGPRDFLVDNPPSIGR